MVDVKAQGALGTVNSREVPCLTGKTYEPFLLHLRHSRLQKGPNNKDNRKGPNDKDNQDNS